jgi:hypothetical protein
MMVQLKSPLHAARCGALAKSNAGATTPVCSYGLDWSWADHPLHRSTISLTATINGASVSLNSQLVLPEVLRMVDYKKNRSQRTCPSAMSRFADNNDSLGAVCDPMGTFSSAADEAELGNGAYTQWGFCDGTGTPLSGNGTYVSGGITVAYTNGIPTVTATQLAYPIFVYLDTTEKVMVSPFVFADAHEFKEQGLSGISQFQLTMQMRDPASARIVQQRSAYSGTVLSAINYQATPFSTSYIQATFLMPAVGQAPPVKCTVPYMDWNPQVSPATAVAAGAVSQQLTSNAFVLQNVPDYLIVYAKPDFAPADLVTNPTQNEWYLPIKSVQVQWEALAPSMQAFSQAQLFAIARNNGLSMSWEQWKGQAWSSLNGGRKIQTGGGPLILRPGRDFAIGDLQAPGVVCNSNVQVSLTIANPSTLAVNAVLTLVPVYSGHAAGAAVRGGRDERQAGGGRLHHARADARRGRLGPAVTPGLHRGQGQVHLRRVQAVRVHGQEPARQPGPPAGAEGRVRAGRRGARGLRQPRRLPVRGGRRARRRRAGGRWPWPQAQAPALAQEALPVGSRNR